MGEGLPITATDVAIQTTVSIPAHLGLGIRNGQKKGAQPLRVVGRQKRVFFRAHAGREAGTSEPHLRLDGGHYR
jgi:hypothetical protein